MHFAGYVYPPGKGPAPVGGSTHLHCTDVHGEWLVVDGEHGAMQHHPRARQGRLRDPRRRQRPAPRPLATHPRSIRLEVIGDADVAARFVAHTSGD